MIITAGSTNVSVYFYIVQDASATSPGEPVTGLLFSDIETGGSASYVRQGAARTDLTLITLANASATHADGGFILVDDTNMPGLYRCDYPDAAFVTAVDQVMLQIVVASAKNAVASPIFVEITDIDLRDNVRGGMTALPNAAADGGGGLPISDAGGLDLDTKLANTNEVTAARMATLTDWVNGGRLDLLLDAIPTTAMRGTDSAALASVCTESRLSELDAANLPAVTDGIQTDLSNATDGLGALKALINTSQADLDIITGASGALLDSTATSPQLVDDIWDEVLTGASHNVTNSGGRRLRQLQEAGGYIGAIWLDVANGTSGTVNFENGTDTMPVNNIADANTLASSLGISRFNIVPGATLTFAVSQINQSFDGAGWILALGGQSIAGSSFQGVNVSGVSTGEPHIFFNCSLGISTFAGGTFINCGLNDTITLTGAVVYNFIDCFHQESGMSSTIDFGAAGSTEVHIHNWHGSLTILNMGAGDVLYFSSAAASLTMDATCTGGTRNSSGNFGLTDNSSGMTINDLGQSYQRLGAPAGASISADMAAVKVDTAATLIDTAEIGAAGVGLTDLGGMSTGMKAEMLVEVIKLLSEQMTESYAADGVAPTLAEALFGIQSFLQERVVSGTTQTTKKIDGATTAMTFTLDDAINPTNITRSG